MPRSPCAVTPAVCGVLERRGRLTTRTRVQLTTLCLAEPGCYRTLHAFAQSLPGGRLEVVALAATGAGSAQDAFDAPPAAPPPPAGAAGGAAAAPAEPRHGLSFTPRGAADCCACHCLRCGAGARFKQGQRLQALTFRRTSPGACRGAGAEGSDRMPHAQGQRDSAAGRRARAGAQAGAQAACRGGRARRAGSWRRGARV